MTATLRDTVSRAVCDAIQPGAVELCDAIEELLPGAGDGPGSVERIKPDVCRLRAGSDGRERSFVLKRFDPWQARRAELVARRWLPAFGVGDRCPQLLATAADRRGQWTWHVYEDLGDGGIDPAHPDRGQVEAVVDLIAELHTRAAGHALLPECRRYCGDLGAPFFAAAVRDAIATLEALAPPRLDPTPEQRAVVDRLLARLYRLRHELPQRLWTLAALGGPETMLHADLRCTDAFAVATPDGQAARLGDWDRAAMGPPSYDVATFLYRFPRPERPWILEAYARAVGRAGWRLPPARDLNAMFETAECSRYVNRVIWPAVAVLEEQAAWGFEELAEVTRWFDALEPALPN